MTTPMLLIRKESNTRPLVRPRQYALTASPTIRTSCIKQFWSTTKVKTVNDEVRVEALIDAKRVTIKESSIRRILSALMLKPPPGMNLAALWHQQSSVLPQTRSLTSQASLEHQLPSPSNDPIPDADKESLKFQELMDLCTRLSNKVLGLESEVIDIKFSFTDKITKLEDKVHKLEEENKILKEKSFKFAKIDTATPVEDKEESFKHKRMIVDMDEEVEVNLAQAKAYNLDLQHLEKVLSMQDIDEEEPVESQ
nr:hypothetical protein [Tanacetum cinerariifolium]